jgi:hypothetical protein
MSCELMDCCQFFKDNMQGMPKTAEYIKHKLCFDNYEVCNRFRIFKELGKDSVPPDLDPDDTEQVQKILQCLRKKHESEGN